jgi:uncharacterized membrane protein YeaQ/YmgE (transglycosylase-associated protein family)
MIGVGLLGAILVGILAGFIAEQLMGGNHGLLTNLVVGLIGALIGPAVLGSLGMMPAGGGFLASLAISTVGAIIFLFILRLVMRKPVA